MEPATLFRKRQQHSEQYGRRALGEKGIGRFAASRLANSLEVVTGRTGADREIRALFDWSHFDDEQRYLDQVTRHDAFQIYLELPAQFASLSGIIKPPEALKSPHYTIKGSIDETGHYTLTFKLPGQDGQECGTGQFTLPNRHPLQCRPFSI